MASRLGRRCPFRLGEVGGHHAGFQDERTVPAIVRDEDQQARWLLAYLLEQGRLVGILPNS